MYDHWKGSTVAAGNQSTIAWYKTHLRSEILLIRCSIYAAITHCPAQPASLLRAASPEGSQDSHSDTVVIVRPQAHLRGSSTSCHPPEQSLFDRSSSRRPLENRRYSPDMKSWMWLLTIQSTCPTDTARTVSDPSKSCTSQRRKDCTASYCWRRCRQDKLLCMHQNHSLTGDHSDKTGRQQRKRNPNWSTCLPRTRCTWRRRWSRCLRCTN